MIHSENRFHYDESSLYSLSKSPLDKKNDLKREKWFLKWRNRKTENHEIEFDSVQFGVFTPKSLRLACKTEPHSLLSSKFQFFCIYGIFRVRIFVGKLWFQLHTFGQIISWQISLHLAYFATLPCSIGLLHFQVSAFSGITNAFRSHFPKSVSF